MVDTERLARKHKRACALAQAFLLRKGGAVLGPEQLARFGNSFVAGWSFEALFADEEKLDLAVLVGEGFPVTPPRLGLFNPPALLTWPHLEENGLLCVFQMH